MMEDVRNCWKECKAIGSTSRIISAKIKSSKLRMKRWIQLNKLGSFSWKDIEVQMADIYKKVVVEGWNGKLRKERIELLVDAWIGSRNEEQV